MRVSVYCSFPHYAAHAAPVHQALPPEMQGGTFGRAFGIWKRPDTEVAIVAGYADGRRVRRPILVEHGAGQGYGTDDPSRAGGAGWGHAALFLAPSEAVADRWRASYPSIPAVAVGDPALDRYADLPKWSATKDPVVALSFRHDEARTAPGARWALPHYRAALPDLASEFEVLGTGHPRALRFLRPAYEAAGIEVVERFNEVVARADVLAVDNSSVGWEWAAIGRPTVWLGAPWYPVDAPPRFPPIAGEEVAGPDELPDAIRRAARNLAADRQKRQEAARTLYGESDGMAAERAARAIRDALGG